MSLQDVSRLANAAGPLLPGEAHPALSVPRSYDVGDQITAAISNVVYTVPSVRLTGVDLIAHTKQYPDRFAIKSDLIAASGYVRPDGKVAYTAFYEALLAAREITDPGWTERINNAAQSGEDAEYDALSEDGQRLYDVSHERLGHNWDHQDIMNFVEELSDIGINTVEEFNEAYYSTQDNTWRWDSDFAREYCESMYGDLGDRLYFSCIDWSEVWRDCLACDFNTIELDGEVHIFRSL